MTTKLEKEFFIKFNIPKLKKQNVKLALKYCQFCLGIEKEKCTCNCKNYNKIYKDIYPQINPDTILKLMKILLKWRGHLEILPYFGTYCISTGTELYSEKADNISDAVLYNCIKHSDDKNIVKDIQKLFKAKEIK